VSKKILRLICNPDKYFENKVDSYKVNELLKSLDPIEWKIGQLKNIFIGMIGILRVGEDKRPLSLLNNNGISKLETGIYGIIEVVEKLDNGNIRIQIINNFFINAQIIDKEQAIKIDKNLRSQGYLNEKVFNKIKKYAPLPVIKDISIKNYFFLENIELINLHNHKEIYIVGENGDGKTLFLQAIVLALRGNEETVNHLIKSTRNKMRLSVYDSNGDEYRYIKNDNNYKNVIAYGVHRSRYKGNKNIKGYLGLFESELVLNNIETWLKDLRIAELEKSDSSISLSTVKEMLNEILDESIDDIKIGKEVIFIERGTEVTINQLSEGYKSVIIWVSDLLSRLATLQPKVKSIREFRGVVLIDEINLHLHPKWGYSIVQKLRGWFPHIQFIFTTHSPTVILGASKDAIFFKIYKENGVSKISQPVDNIKNLMANSVTTSPLFNLDNAKARYSDDDIDTSDDFLYSKIHKQIAQHNREKGITETDIFKMIGESLIELTKDDKK
jgi:predicted ATP-binding protein involved in virulence